MTILGLSKVTIHPHSPSIPTTSSVKMNHLTQPRYTTSFVKTLNPKVQFLLTEIAKDSQYNEAQVLEKLVGKMEKYVANGGSVKDSVKDIFAGIGAEL